MSWINRKCNNWVKESLNRLNWVIPIWLKPWAIKLCSKKDIYVDRIIESKYSMNIIIKIWKWNYNRECRLNKKYLYYDILVKRGRNLVYFGFSGLRVMSFSIEEEEYRDSQIRQYNAF